MNSNSLLARHPPTPHLSRFEYHDADESDETFDES